MLPVSCGWKAVPSSLYVSVALLAAFVAIGVRYIPTWSQGFKVLGVA
jgi:hypothetical protein